MGQLFCMPWNGSKKELESTGSAVPIKGRAPQAHTAGAGGPGGAGGHAGSGVGGNAGTSKPMSPQKSPGKKAGKEAKAKKYKQLDESEYVPPVLAKTYAYFGTVCFGLEDPAAEEINELLKPMLLRILHGKIIFTTNRALDEVLKLRCLQNLYAYVVEVEWPEEGASQRAMETMGGMPLHGDAKWEEAMELFGKRFPTVIQSEYRVVCSRNCFCKVKCQNFMATDVENAVQLGLQYKYPTWRSRGKGCPLQIFAHVVDRRAVLGINLTPETMDKRFLQREASNKSIMRASLAASISRLAKITPGSYVVDPMCADGILLSEASVNHPGSMYCGGDVSMKIVQRAVENAKHVGAGKCCDFVRFDGVYFPWRSGSVDVIISDMPCGVRTDSYRIDNTLYKKLLKEMSRVLGPGGRVVIVSFERRLLDALLKKKGDLDVVKEYKLSIGQFPNAVLYLLQKH